MRTLQESADEIVEGTKGTWHEALVHLRDRAAAEGKLTGVISRYHRTRLEEGSDGYVVVAPNVFARDWLARSAADISEALGQVLKLEHAPRISFRSD